MTPRKSETRHPQDPGAPVPPKLFNATDPSEYDDIAVRSYYLRTPSAASQRCPATYAYPLHAAVRLGAAVETVRVLCDAHPQAAAAVDSSNRTLLHIACARPSHIEAASLDVIKFLYSKCPASVSVCDQNGCTPLHLACHEAALSLEVARYLVDRSPQALEVLDYSGRTPLHIACARDRVDEGVVTFLAERTSPKSLAVRNAFGCTPLSCVCRYRASLDGLVRLLVDRCPDALTVRDHHGLLPLHKMVLPNWTNGNTNQASLRSIQLLADRYPAALEVKCFNGGNTPLHYACIYEAPIEVITLLVKSCPRALELLDDDHHTPLHQSCINDVDQDAVKFLAEQRPESLRIRDAFGCTPLSCVCRHRASLDGLIRFLVDLCPGAVEILDGFGFTPLHTILCPGWAGGRNETRSSETIKFLADRYPRALELRAQNGNTPLHLASYFGAPTETVKLLIERYPGALEIANRSDRMPADYAMGGAKESPAEVIAILLALEDLSSLFDVERNDEQVMAKLKAFHTMKWRGGVALVLDKFPHMVHRLDERMLPEVLSKELSLGTVYAMVLGNPVVLCREHSSEVQVSGEQQHQSPSKKSRYNIFNAFPPLTLKKTKSGP